MIDWAIALPSFLTAAVEWVEAFTIVLAVSLSIGWRRAVMASLTALLVLAAMTAATGGILQLGDNLQYIQYGIGVFLMLFGVRWLAKAIARHAGLKALHDEDEEFRHTQELTRRGDDKAAWLIAFNGVMLEGLEVWLVVVALSMKTQHWASGAGAAIAALVVVVAAGLAARKPLSKVPENVIKFVVGAMIVAFGTFWTLESAGGTGAWPFGDYALLALFAFYLVAGYIIATVMRSQVNNRIAGATK